MSRIAKCHNCKIELPTEKFKHNNKYYCKCCYDKVIVESKEYKQLIDYICTNFSIKAPTGFMLKQIKKCKNELNYNYAGMTYTLWYCKEVLKKEFQVKYGVSLIEFYYEDAENYYQNEEKMLKKTKIYNNIKNKPITIKQFNICRQKNNNLINIDSMLKSGDNN